jgi:hypothetical protein
LRRGVRPRIPSLPSRSSALITWRPQCSEETFVPLGGKGPSVLQTLGTRTIVVKAAAVSTQGRLLHATTDRRILCTHYPFNFGSVAAVDSKLFRSADGFRFAGSPTGEEGGSEKPWKQRLRLKSALGEEALNLHCAKKCRGRDVRVRALNLHCAKKCRGRDVRVRVEVRRAPWRRRARGTARRQRKCAVSALGVEEKVIARESAQGHVRRRCAFVWRRSRSGHARVYAGHTGR